MFVFKIGTVVLFDSGYVNSRNRNVCSVTNEKDGGNKCPVTLSLAAQTNANNYPTENV